jgi:hypothetical protein
MYSLDALGNVIRDLDGAFIPNDPANSDYIAYLAWLAEGNAATPYAAPTPTWASYQLLCKSALERSDTTVARISEAISLGYTTSTTADVVAYMQWRRALRAILSAATGTPEVAPPTEPAYPAGT